MKRSLAKMSFCALFLLFAIAFCLVLQGSVKTQNLVLYLALACILPVLLVLNLIALHPVVYMQNEPEARGDFTVKENSSAIGLYLKAADVMKDAEPKQFNYSLAWLNFLSKEFAFFSLLDFKRNCRIDFHKKKAIILTRSVIDSLDDNDVFSLEDFVSAGGLLCFELPDARLARLSGCELTGKSFFPKAITDLQAPAYFLEALKGMPIFSQVAGLRQRTKDVEVLLSMDDSPAICENHVGRGVVISIFFDLGMQLTMMRQGTSCLPAAKKQTKPKGSLEIQNVIVDIVADQRMLHNDYPYVDILEAFIFRLVSSEALIPSFWYYPGFKKAAALITHDEDYYGQRCSAVNEYEQAKGISATFFALADSNISSSTLKNIDGNGSEIAIHWNRFLLHIDNSGLHGNILKTLKAQINKLSLGGNLDISSSRIHWLKIDKDPLRVFRIIAASGIKIDSSFGPHNKQRGYVFGSGFPYYLLDENGGIIKMLEFPFLIQDRRDNVSVDYVERLLQDALDKWHTGVMVLYHPHHFSSQDGVWKDCEIFLSLIKNESIWQVNLRDYVSFWEERQNSSLESSFSYDDDTLLMRAEAVGEKTIRIPRVGAHKRLRAVFSGDKQIEYNEIDGYAFFLAKAGHSEFKACYETIA